ncbi:MAG: Txe/YoeB family addiction module toxin [Selenomonadaceae bacterium]|nr:Txe/YoeB family addiction module toxin [Selenomonadaceae bacterium]
MYKLWNEIAWADYVDWQHQDDNIVERINLLLKDIDRNGVSKGIGKPEKLKHRKGWSRRIDEKHRLIYDTYEGKEQKFLYIISCKGHYE